eukprot:1699700-Rhodomonas_salina.1
MAICLRACHATCGTEIATCYAMRGTDIATCYAKTGPKIARATRCARREAPPAREALLDGADVVLEIALVLPNTPHSRHMRQRLRRICDTFVSCCAECAPHSSVGAPNMRHMRINFGSRVWGLGSRA